MKITNYVASLTICASLLGTPACSKAEGDTKQTSIDELTQAEVDTLMQRSSVDEILKEEYQSGRVKKVEYTNGKTNFRELVYQENLPAAQRKPVIMLVADSDGKGWFDAEKYAGEKGNAIILKKFIQQGTDFNFVVYDPSLEPDFRETREGKFNLGAELKNECVTATPSVVIYSPWTFTKGERKGKHDGTVERLDILGNGPVDQEVLKFSRNIGKWVNSNLIGNGQYVWRANNTFPLKWSKVSL